uniref:AB hydrolase-1 domain-containing protein n=1 Tax=Eutreptiella gymnastica TaxID=73025 RepID=A0A7S4LI67_9EUGL
MFVSANDIHMAVGDLYLLVAAGNTSQILWIVGAILAVLVVNSVCKYITYDTAPARLIYKPSSWNRRLLAAMDTLPGTYYPTPYMVHDALQTLFVAIGRLQPKLPSRDEPFEVEPGEIIHLTWIEPEGAFGADSTVPIVFVLHGVDGNAGKAYNRHMAKLIWKEGWRCVLPTRRGCNPAIANQKSYEYYDPDFALVVRHVAAAFPRAKLYAIGMSAGANIVTKYAGMTGTECPLSGAVSVGNGYDWDEGTQHLSKRWIWNYIIMYTSRRQFYYKHEELYTDPGSPLHGRVCPRAMASVRGFRDFDTHFSSRLHEYDDVESYYQAQSCKHNMRDIAIPMLFLHTEDDPLCPPALIPFNLIYHNPQLMLAITNRGGHLGWAKGWLPFAASSSTWGEEVAADYVKALVRMHSD